MNSYAGALLIAFAGVHLFAQQSATIGIDARRVVHPVPRTVFGGFMEPLRSAIYTGGIWAQLLDNPSFEDNLWSAAAIVHIVQGRPELAQAARLGLPIPWESLYAQGARFEPRWGDAANSSRSLLIMGLPGRQTGVRQAIYPPVHRVLRYTGSIWAKPVSGGKRIEVSLRRRNHPDEVLAKAPIPEYRNLGGAIWLAGMLNMLVRVADFVPIANMTGIVEYGRLWEKRGITYGVPSYWAFRMYSNAGVANLLDTKVDVAQYSVQDGARRTPDIPDVPYLDVVAVANRTGDTITLFAVNRSLTTDIASTIALAGFSVHSASGKLLAAGDIYAGNDDDRPEAVVPTEFTLAAAGSTFSHTFPKASVTVIELR